MEGIAARILATGLLMFIAGFGAFVPYEEQKGFVVLPKRWLVERTFERVNWCRRLSKDYEILPQTSEAFIYVAMIPLMLKQFA